MWLIKKSKSYISLLINNKRVSWFYFTKDGNRYALQVVVQEEPVHVGILENQLINTAFFAQWLLELFELYNIKEPQLAIRGAFDVAQAFQYNLICQGLQLPVSLIGLVKCNKNCDLLVDNELDISVNKKDLCEALSLWEEVDENGV